VRLRRALRGQNFPPTHDLEDLVERYGHVDEDLWLLVDQRASGVH
jgi:hypothetical protein